MLKLDSVCQNILHNDANLIGFFEQQLEQVLANTYDVLYPALKGTQLVPIDTSVPSGADSFAFFSYDMVGMSKVIADYSDDLPAVDITGEKEIRKIKSIGNHFGYSIQEIRASQFAGTPLEQRRANASRLATEQKVNRTIWGGDAPYSLYGFLTHPNIPTGDVPNDGAGGNTEWTTKTPVQILRDMEEAITEVYDTTNGVHMPDTLIIPIAQHSYIKRTPYSTLSPQSILTVFKANNPEINITWVNELKGAGTAGKDVMIAYENNIDRIAFHIPQAYETFPPQAINLKIKVPTHSRIGGFVAYYPLSANIKEGI